jgi:hypothetical protein
MAGACLAGLMLPSAAASAQTSQVLDAGQAVRLDGPLTGLAPLGDGRLASYGAEADVSGEAVTGRLDSGEGELAAAGSAELVVLHVTVAPDVDLTDGVDRPVSLTVTARGVSAQLEPSLSAQASDDAFFVVAVPRSGPAVLTFSVGGLLPQRLDLRTGRRTGSAPAALYRSATPVTEVSPTAVSSFSASAGPAGSASGRFGVSGASLSYWRPGTTVLAPDPGDAFLDVQFASADLAVPGHEAEVWGAAGPLPAGGVSFVLPDGRTVAAQSQVTPGEEIDLFSGDFFAPVPAGISSVKVVVKLSSLAVISQVTQLTLTFAAPLTATVTFPAPIALRQGPPPGMSMYAPSGRGSGSAWWLILAVLVVVLVIAGVIWRGRRRHRPLAARPVTWPPPGMAPPVARMLSGPTATALGPKRPDDEDPPAPVTSPRIETGGSLDAVAVKDGGPRLWVRVLGPLEVEGLVQPIRRSSVRRLLVALALTPERPLSADELAMIISDHPDRDPKAASVHSYASILRRCLPAGTLPDAGPAGYRLDHSAVAVDWAAVTAVARQAERDDWGSRAAGVLELVRGPALQGDSWEGIEPVARSITAAVEDLARRAAAALLAAGDPTGAERAATRGLAAAPGSVGLWQSRLDAAAAGSGSGLEQVWSDARQQLGADAALLVSHYQQLRRHLDSGSAPASPI